MLERDLFAKADPDRGRFRSFLRAVCDRLSRRPARPAERPQARGRGPVLPIDAVDAEGRYSREPAHELTPERIFDRSWALDAPGSGPGPAPPGVRGRRQGGDVRGAARRPYRRSGIHPLRDDRLAAGDQRGGRPCRGPSPPTPLRNAPAAEIAATVDDPAEVDDEIRALFVALEA